MTSEDGANATETPLEEVRLSLLEILRILKEDASGYESQLSRIRELAQRCLEVVDQGRR